MRLLGVVFRYAKRGNRLGNSDQEFDICAQRPLTIQALRNTLVHSTLMSR
jgi:hypothetical protein